MKNELIIFFSWQTSAKTDCLNNKDFILSCINKAAEEIAGKGDLKDVSFKVLQGTGGEPGSPNMIATCLERNDKCHIFIADISVDKKFNKIQRWVNRQPDLRERPNENVMYELGRADGHLCYKQVIHVANTVFGDVSKNDYLRPVDIRDKRRPITFFLADNNAPDVAKVREELIEDLKIAIRKSAKAAIEHIHEELKPYDSCEHVFKELNFKKKFIFNKDLIENRKAVAENNGVLRVLGTNGVGKTRLVLETILKEPDEELKLYCDCWLTTEDKIIDTTTKIFEKQISAVLILDNCDKTLFEKLLTQYNRKNAQNRLYAIFDDAAEKKICDGYNITRFNFTYEDVVDGIIAGLYGKKDEVSAKIKEFACGNPLFAVQAIEGVINTGDIRDFNNQKLIANMLSAPEGSDERIIADTLALFSSIGYEGDAHKELEEIALNKNITGLSVADEVLVNEFDAQIKLYLERGLMQRFGVFVRFRSPAISKILEDEWFDKCTATQLEAIIMSLGKKGMAINLIPPFFDKIRENKDNSRVADLLKEMLQPGRLLTKIDFINSEVGSKIYRSIVEIVPDDVCDSLFLSLGGLNMEEMKQIKDGRRELVWTLEKLCYKPETFEKAAKLMLLLGCSEVEFISNNATGQFVSLFPVYLPATSVPLSTRLDFLKKEILSSGEKPLIMKALDRAICTMNFIRFGGDVTLNGKKYSFYEPKNEQEIEDYITGCLDLIQQEIDGNTEYKDGCVKMLASNLRALNSLGLNDLIMSRVEKVAKSLNYEWDDLLHMLHFAKKDKEIKLNDQRLNRTQTLIQLLTKTDFVSRFASVESYECNDYLGMSDAEHKKVVDEKYEALADEMVSQKLYSIDTLKGIYNSQTFLPMAFATKLSSLHTPEEQIGFAEDSIDILQDSVNSIFVYYVMGVEEEAFAKIVDLIYEKEKYWLMFSLVAVRNYAFDHHYVDLLFELAEQKKVKLSYFITYWQYLRIDRLYTEEAVGLLKRLLKLSDSFVVVLQMGMSQYLSSTYNQPEMDKLFEDEMIKRSSEVVDLIANSHYSHILGCLLSKGNKNDLARALADGIFNYIIASDDVSVRYEVERVLSVLFDQYFGITWKAMSGLMTTADDEDKFFKFYFAFGFSTIHNPFPSLIFKQANLPTIMGWCGQHTDVGPYRVMAIAPLSEGENLSEPVMLLIDKYGSDKKVLTALSDKLGTFSGPVSVYESRAKMIEPLTIHKNPDVSVWAELEIKHLKYCQEQSQKIEENFMIPGRIPSHNWTLDLDDEEVV